jgi:glycosyltransferase involved in cell wall biosynthesis
VSNCDVQRPRVLLIQTRGRHTLSRRERAQRQIRGEETRSMLLAETLGCDVLDEETLAEITGLWGSLYRRLPPFVAQALEARRRASSYDVVMTWSERHSVAVAALFAVTRARTAHLALMFWISKPSVRLPLVVFRSGIDRIITWSSVQRRVAIEQVGFAPGDVVLVRHPVDLQFFHPIVRAREIVFSAGSTMRDFDTLVRAVTGVDVRVRIAASLVVVLRGLKVAAIDVGSELACPPNVQIVSMEPLQVRDAFAAAQVVVVPLLPCDIDAGVNVVLEAMAMARPVIVSRTIGQIDVIDDGFNGFFVEPLDAAALRSKIQTVCADPAAAEQVGLRARAYVEEHHSLEGFIQRVQVNVQELTDRAPARRGYTLRSMAHWWRPRRNRSTTGEQEATAVSGLGQSTAL